MPLTDSVRALVGVMHHFQCDWHNHGYPQVLCNCGLTGPRTWWMDHLPADRAPTKAEFEAWDPATVAYAKEQKR